MSKTDQSEPRSKAKRKRAATHVADKDGSPGKVGKRAVVGITAAQYNALFLAYQEKPSVPHAAKAAGVQARTAHRYIDGPGAPEMGMEPIAARVARIQRAVQEHQDLTLRDFRRAEVKIWQEALKTSEIELAIHRTKLAKQLKAIQAGEDVDPEQPFGQAIKARDVATQRVERLLDAPDATIAHRNIGPDPLDDMTEAELLEYGRSGVLPERHRR